MTAPVLRYRGAFAEMLISAILGLVAALVLSIDAVKIAANPDAVLSCNINAFISCGKVALSWQSQLLGFPNAFLGLMTEPVVITVAVAGLAGVRFPRWFMVTAQFVYGLGLALAWWLFSQSYFVIGAFCPWCLLITMTTTLVFASMTRVNLLEGNIRLPGRLNDVALSGLRLGADHAGVALIISAFAAAIITRYF